MSFKFFVVPLGSADAERELNSFLRSHKVLTVDRRRVDQGPSSFWSFCVDYLDHAAPASATPGGRPPGARAKVDYKELLTPEQFAVFARLRELRKEIAQAEAVPVYTVFTNEQLAEMVRRRVASKAALAKIDGVGEARVEKYGDRLLAVLGEAFQNEAGRAAA
jgi:superfamily II DNA helicase RecQ